MLIKMNNELDKIYKLCREFISPKICFIRKSSHNVFEACEHRKEKKIIYFFKLEENNLKIFNTLELEM